MKRIFFLIPAFLFGALSAYPTFAQEKSQDQKEITIRLKSGEVKTIKPGEMSPLIVEGKAISPDDIQSITVTRNRSGRRGARTVQGYKLDGITFLGVATQKNDKGAEITEVSSGSPAEKAGLQKGDIITKLHETAIDGPEALSKAVRSLKPDQKVNIEILRNGKKQTLSAVLGEQNNRMTIIDVDSVISRFGPFDQFNFKMPDSSFKGHLFRRLPYFPRSEDIYGFRIRPRSGPSLGLQIQETENSNGVTVLKVTPDSYADKAGIKVGDLITSINGNTIKSVDDVTGKITGKEGEEYKLNLIRDKKPMTVTIKVPKKLKKVEL